MSGRGTQTSFRKAFGAIKDSTTVGIAKVNSGYKELDIAIVKATNHVERPAKEKFIRAIFASISATRPRADVAYCIHALARRLAKTKNWAVALKTLIVIHRSLREVDPTFHEELVNYGKSRSHMLNLAHFKDDSSSNAWDYSSWVRTYALFLEERLECFRILKYDVATERSRTKDLETEELLEHLTALQQLQHRAISCQPEGAAAENHIIHLALSMVFLESTRIHEAVSDGTVNLIDKFFEMQRSDAVKALSIYRKAGHQAEKLSEFLEVCKNVNVCREEKMNKIEQPPASFIQAMEEYVRDAPRTSTTRKDEVSDSTPTAPRVMLAIEMKTTAEVHRETSPPPPPPPPHTEPEQIIVEEAQPVPEPPDLLGMNDPTPDVSQLDEKNALSLAIVPVGMDQPTSDMTNSPLLGGGAGWELALVTTTPNENSGTINKLGGGFDKLTLDSLYDDALRRNGQVDTGLNHWQHQHKAHDPFFASAPSLPPQVSPFSVNQHAYMWQQQQQHQQQHMVSMMMQQQQQQQPPLNPFGSPHGGGLHLYGARPEPTGGNPYRGLI